MNAAASLTFPTYASPIGFAGSLAGRTSLFERVRLFERDTPLQTEHRPNNDMRPNQGGGGGRRRRTRRRHHFGNQNPGQFHEQFPQAESGPPMLTAVQLAEKTKTEL